MPQSLYLQLIPDIIQYIHNESLAAGTRLPERILAQHLRVSRSPIRAALVKMAENQLISQHPDGGYVVAQAALTFSEFPYPVRSPADELYFRIAEERLSGALPEKNTENDFMRRYEVTRSTIVNVLKRIHHEGWIERLPGHGWQFVTTIFSESAYQESYRFRKMIEPAGILEPSFQLDKNKLAQCQQEQMWLVNGGVFTASPAQIYDANTRLHEVIAECSGNAFILDSLCRLNRVRRLIEYSKAVDREQALRRCKEHLQLISLLLEGAKETASDLMRLHLSDAMREKREYKMS